MSILLSDPDGNNEQIRVMLIREIKDALNPKDKEEDCCEMPEEGISFIGKNPGKRKDYANANKEVKEEWEN